MKIPFNHEIMGLFLGGPALFAAIVLYMCPLKKRTAFAWRLVGAGIVFAGLIFWESSWIAGNRFLPIAAYSLIFLQMTLILWWCCILNLSEALYCAACAYLTQHLMYTLLALLGRGNNVAVSLVEKPEMVAVIIGNCGVYLAGYLLMYWVLVRKLSLSDKLHINSLHSLVAMVITVLGSIVLSHFSTLQAKQQGSEDTFWLCRGYDILCCLVALWAQYGKVRELRVQELMIAELDLKRQQITQYENYQENIDLINYKCHDLKQQVAALRETNSGKMPEEVLSKVEESVMIYDSFVKTGNEALDTILTERNLWCEKNGITMSCIVDGKCLAFMDTVDLFAIFGNALANAIESVSKITEREKRMITVMAFVRMDVLFIQFENYYESEIIRHGELPETTKQRDGSHGYGLKSIRYSVQKYRGNMLIETENHIFILRITIPVAGI